MRLDNVINELNPETIQYELNNMSEPDLFIYNIVKIFKNKNILPIWNSEVY